MATCQYCGAETELYEIGLPVCLKCSDQWESKVKPSVAPQEVQAALIEDVLEATALNSVASREFDLVMGQTPSGLPQPDGSQRIQNASRQLSKARKGMMTAHNRLNDFLTHGIVPEDVKRRGR